MMRATEMSLVEIKDVRDAVTMKTHHELRSSSNSVLYKERRPGREGPRTMD